MSPRMGKKLSVKNSNKEISYPSFSHRAARFRKIGNASGTPATRSRPLSAYTISPRSECLSPMYEISPKEHPISCFGPTGQEIPAQG